MQRVTRIINITTIVVAILLAIAIFAITLFGCGDAVDKPTEPDPIDELYNQPVDINQPQYQIHPILEPPKVTTHVPKPDPDLKDIPKPKNIINVDQLIGNGAMGVNMQLGAPIEVIGNREFQIRQYDLFDNNVAEIMMADDVIVSIHVLFHRGYDTSKEALNAVGFTDEQLTFVKHTPRQEINGATKTAQDVYTVKTDNNQFNDVAVSQNKHNVWDIVAIKM